MPVTVRAFVPRLSIFSCIMISAMLNAGRGGSAVAGEIELKPVPTLGVPAISADAQAGYTQLYLGKLDEAEQAFKRAVDANPQDAEALYGQAMHAIGQCDLQRSMELLCQAVKAGAAASSPWTELYLARLARTLPYCSDPKPFVTFTENMLQDAKAPPYAQDILRRIYGDWLESRGKYSEARATLKPLNAITQWSLCGPFDNRDNSGFSKEYEPEKEIDFEKAVQGRNRQVKWFRPNADPADGRIELSDLFEPHIHTIAYGVTFVKADADAWAVVRAGAAGALSVWVNNKLAGSSSDHNDWGDAKLAAPVMLHKGWNKVLVKAAVVEDTAWTFSLRFCTLEGGSFPGLQAESTDKALAEYKAAPEQAADANAKPGAFEPGLFERLTQLLKTEPDNIAALSGYAYLHEIENRGKKDDKGAPKQLLHAIELAPKCPYLRLQLAASSSDSNEARLAAEAALKSHPELPAALEVLANLAEEGHNHVQAEDYARQACTKLGDKVCGLSTLSLADALIERSDGASSGRRRDGGSDRRAEAFRLVSKFTACHPFCSEGWHRMAQLELSSSARRNVVDKALTFCGGDDQLRQMYCDDLTATGKERQAAEFLAGDERSHPYSVSAVLAASNQFRRVGDIEQASKILLDARTWAPENPDLIAALALANHYQGKVSDAMQLYQEALLLKPNSPRIKDCLAELNEGKSTDKKFFASYDIALKTLDTPKPEAYPNDNAVNLLKQEVVKLNPNFSASRMIHIIGKVLRPAGVQELNRHQIWYDPDRQVVDILRAAVITPDGREISRADVRDMSTSAAAGVETRIYDEHHMKQVYFHDLETGSTIDLQYTIRDTGDNLFGDYFSDTNYLTDDKPTIKNQYILDYPKSVNIQSRTFHAKIQPEHLDSPDTQREIMKWEHNNTPGLVREAAMPPLVDELAQLQITTMASWEEVGKWYWHLASDQLKVDDDLKKELTNITKECKTDLDKVKAVQQFVIHQIRYLGIEFGRNGYKPHAASESYKARYGDCKDKATLITAMLKELNIDARLVLIRTINAGAVPQDSLPMPNLFNHCIAYVPNVEGRDYFIDGTADYHRLGDVPWADRSAQVLVVEPNAGKFVQIPLNKPQDNLFEQRFDVNVAADGSAKMALRNVRHGQWAPRYREMTQTPGLYERDIKSYAAHRLSGAELVTWKSSKADEEGGMWMEAEFKIPTFATPSGDRKALAATIEPMTLSQRYCAESKRNYDLDIYFPWSRHMEITYTLADPLKAASTPANAAINEPFGKYSRKTTVEGNTVKIVEDFELSVSRVKVPEYDSFKTFCNKIDAYMDEKVLIEGK